MDRMECLQCVMWSWVLVPAEGYFEGGSTWRFLWWGSVWQSSMFSSSMSWSVLSTSKMRCISREVSSIWLCNLIYLSPLVVNGQWSEWTEWSQCDATCGGGVRQRNRTCSSPPPKNGGRDCEGITRQSQSCNNLPCTKDAGTQTGGCQIQSPSWQLLLS